MSIDLISQIDYPDSDGQPMSDNTLQFRWIVTIQSGIDYLFTDDPAVFVAGDLLWYPVEGDNKTRIGPDVMVVFGRPKGERGSYRQWVEGDIPPQVVFEVLSPSNGPVEMAAKRRFYEWHGVEEYYEYDPDRIKLRGWLREGEKLLSIDEMNGWISPRLGIRFNINGDLKIYSPDGQVFQTSLEVREHASQMQQLAEHQRNRADLQEDRADLERQRANQAEEKAVIERQRANQAEEKAVIERQRANQAEEKADIERQRANQAEEKADIERQRANQAEEKAVIERQRANQAEEKADIERLRADLERDRADLERDRAHLAGEKAKRAGEQVEAERQRADQAEEQAAIERQRAERLLERLRTLGLDSEI